jgi:predicted DNA-binding protein
MHTRRTMQSTVGPIRFPAPLVERMDELAFEMGHTRSSLIRNAVREYIRNAL